MDHIDSKVTRPMKSQIHILCLLAQEAGLKGGLKEETIMAKLHSHKDQCMKEYGRRSESKRSSYPAQVAHH